jgi:putative transposase
MTCTQQRQTLLTLIREACAAGAKLESACAQIGLSARTVQRWQRPEGREGDRRVAGLHERWEPTNKLSETEREAAMAVLNGDEFKNLPPSQIVPRLADQGRYIASESTLYRLLYQRSNRPAAANRAEETGVRSRCGKVEGGASEDRSCNGAHCPRISVVLGDVIDTGESRWQFQAAGAISRLRE